jgi:nucleotide-binding universal stress UspA family protein
MPTFEPKCILCPIDFSQHSAAALRAASGLAKAFGSEVVVLHAQRLEAPVYFTVAQAQALKAQLRRSANAARKYVSRFGDDNLVEGTQHSVMLGEDDPVAAILRALRKSRAELLVMGTHGRSGLERIRLGSVTESVLRQVKVPVLTVGPRIKPAASLSSIRRVLCPVNYSELARIAFEHAVTLAEKTQAELLAMHAVENDLGATESDSHRQLCEWVPAEVRDRCEVKEVVKQGSAAEQILLEARNSRADIIVVGAHPRSFLGTILFGSTTELLIRNAPCPVLSVISK